MTDSRGNPTLANLKIQAMTYSKRFDEALMVASDLHRQQLRKGTSVPYVTHLLAVAALVGECGGSEDDVIAALLHDSVEDQGGLEVLQAIEQRFGKVVADIVESCSDAHTTPKPPWRARKEAYLSHLAEATPSSVLVSCADKLHNARTILADLREIGPELWQRFRGGREGTLWYYRELVGQFHRCGAPQRLVGELERTVGQIETEAERMPEQ